MKTSRVLLALVILLCVPPLAAQSPGQRSRAPFPQRSREPVRPTPPAPRDAELAEPVADAVRTGPGIAEPPAQGYVKSPDSPVPGTTAHFVIADPLGLSFWELYDRAKSVTLTGKVTKVDWTNPNSYIYLDAGNGAWAVESSLIQFKQAHVTPAVRVGETITVSGFLPKDAPVCPLSSRIPRSAASFLRDSHLIRAAEITTVFGQRLSLGRPPTAAEMEERLRNFSPGC